MIKLKVKYLEKIDKTEVEYKRNNSNAYEHLFAMAILKEKLMNEDTTLDEIIEFLKDFTPEEAEKERKREE